MYYQQHTPARRHRSFWLALPLAAITLVACASQAQEQSYGAFLTGRVAQLRSDTETAASSLLEAAENARDNSYVQLDAIQAQVEKGDFRTALRLANQMHELGQSGWLMHLVRYTDFMVRSDVEGAMYSAAAISEEVLIGVLLEAWAIAASGDRSAAAAKAVEYEQLVTPLGLMHQWLLTHHLGAELNIESETGDPREGEVRSRAVLAANAEGAESLRLKLEAAGLGGPMYLPSSGLLDDWPEIGPGEIPAPTGAAWAMIDFAVRIPFRARIKAVWYRLAERLNPELDEVRRGVLHGLHGSTLRAWIERNVKGNRRAGPGLWIEAADYLHRVGSEEEALAMIDEAMAKFPDSVIVHFERGSLYRMAEQYDTAQKALTKGLELYMAAAEAVEYSGAGPTLHERAVHAVEIRSESSRNAFIKALYLVAKYDSALWYVYLQRGICFERLGEWPAAEADLLKALDLNPDEPTVANYLAYSWVDQGINLHRGKEMLERALAMRPNDGNIMDSVGWVKYRLGDIEGALVDLENAVQLEPAAAEIYDHIGDALWRLGNFKEARFQWARVLTLDARDEIRERAERKLRDGLLDSEL